MRAQSQRFYFKEHFAYLRKIIGTFYVTLSLFRRFLREKVRTASASFRLYRLDFTNVGVAVYAVALASIGATFVWFSLLMYRLG